jgi:F-type H+-transporting ATPase subunit a
VNASSLLPAPLLAEGDAIEHILPHHLWSLGGYDVTNHVLMLALAAVLMLIVFPLAAASRAAVPSGFRNLVESVLVYLREQVARPALHEATDRFMPFLWTLFFLILFANLLGALPIDPLVTAITGHPSHFGGTATGNLSITAGLAICAFFLIHVGGMKEQGVFKYWKSFVPHVPLLLWPLMLALEIIGSIVKPFALAIRLFANMIAGHIVLAVLLGFASILASGVTAGGLGVTLAAVLGATFISLLELFVAFLQAYIFTYLTTLFLGMAVHPEH